jgi:5-methylcytosine-specific restriction protein A
MPLRPPTPCSYHGFPPCPALVYGGGRCPEHTVFVKRAAAAFRRETQGDTYAGRGHRRRFRPGVLRKHPYCRCNLDHAPHGAGACPQPSTDADHWPLERRALVALGLDPDDPQHGRGLCHPCHSAATARLQPGGWHRAERHPTSE